MAFQCSRLWLHLLSRDCRTPPRRERVRCEDHTLIPDVTRGVEAGGGVGRPSGPPWSQRPASFPRALMVHLLILVDRILDPKSSAAVPGRTCLR